MLLRVCKFESCPGHFSVSNKARMAELVDALVSGTSVRTDVQVRVLFRAQADFKSAFFILFLEYKKHE